MDIANLQIFRLTKAFKIVFPTLPKLGCSHSTVTLAHFSLLNVSFYKFMYNQHKDGPLSEITGKFTINNLAAHADIDLFRF